MTDAPVLAGLSISDSPERWGALGFAIDELGETVVGEVRLRLGIAPPGDGIVSWTLSGAGPLTLPGLVTAFDGAPAPPAGVHPNGAVEIDHVVVMTPEFDRLAAEIGFRRVAERAGRRQGFRRLGRPILEVVEAVEAPRTAFWGVTFTVGTLTAFAAGNRYVGDPRDAVQPGRRIAAVSRDARLSTRVAFMDPEPPRS